MTATNADLLRMRFADLQTLFHLLSPGPIPNGSAQGTAIVAFDTPLSPTLAALTHLLLWQGKVFNASKGQLVNRVLLGLFELIVADVYIGPSWIDQQPCIVLDYSKRSLVAHRIRDEIRMIAPGFYFGPVYWDYTPLMHFSLQFAR